jgi:signal transduction histidine kinase
MEKDRGAGFARHLQTTPGWKRFSASRSASDIWYLEFGFAKVLEDFAEMDRVDGVIATPGQFHGEVDSFNLSPSSEPSTFGSTAELKKFVSLLSGIRVYRDGFGIRVNPDWLNLAKQWTGGGSWYGLRPQNTLGYIALSARDNACLQETTDREGFKETAHYLNFYELLQTFVRDAADAQEFFRRSWIDYRRLNAQANASVPSDTSPEAVAQEVARSLNRSASYRISLRSVAEKLARTIESTNRQLSDINARGSVTPSGIKANIEELRDSIRDASATVREVEAYLEELRLVEKKAEVVVEQIGALRSQIDQVFEIIGLGMTAEALTHELENISTNLSRRTQEIGKYARSQVRDSKVLSYLEHVKSALAEFRRQLTFLAPSLRFVREQRDDVDLWQFSKDIHQYYTQRFHDSALAILPRDTSRKSFHVAINKGKLIQIFDNLLLNSEYWLKEDLQAQRITHGQIVIDLNKPYVTVSDNGRGVDPVIESSVFEPFVSAKGKGKGRGLGLYIVRQLLEAESCNIALTPERNTWDRLYKFELDLSGVLRD